MKSPSLSWLCSTVAAIPGSSQPSCVQESELWKRGPPICRVKRQAFFRLWQAFYSVCCRHIPALCRSQKMSTAPLVPQRLAWPRPKYIWFAVIGVMAVYVLRHDEHFLIDAKDPEWPHIQHFKWWLLPIGLMGACALLLGPMQFSERLRRRFTKFHRVVGRFYVAGVFVAAPLGFYIQHFEKRTGSARSFSIAAAVALRVEEMPESWKEYFLARLKILSSPAPIFHFCFLVSALSFCLLLSSPPPVSSTPLFSSSCKIFRTNMATCQILVL